MSVMFTTFLQLFYDDILAISLNIPTGLFYFTFPECLSTMSTRGIITSIKMPSISASQRIHTVVADAFKVSSDYLPSPTE